MQSNQQGSCEEWPFLLSLESFKWEIEELRICCQKNIGPTRYSCCAIHPTSHSPQNDVVVGVVAFIDSNNSDSACGDVLTDVCKQNHHCLPSLLQHPPTDEETMMTMTAETTTTTKTVTRTTMTAVRASTAVTMMTVAMRIITKTVATTGMMMKMITTTAAMMMMTMIVVVMMMTMIAGPPVSCPKQHHQPHLPLMSPRAQNSWSFPCLPAPQQRANMERSAWVTS